MFKAEALKNLTIFKLFEINKTDILRNYHDQAIVITLADRNETLSGMIVDDTPADHCIFVKDPNLVQY